MIAALLGLVFVGQTEAPSLLDVTSWHFVEVAGDPVPLTGDLLRDDIYAIDIYSTGFVGYGGCNRFSAVFSRVGDQITPQLPLTSTRRACQEAVTNRERRLIAIMSAPMRTSSPDADTLVLTGETGSLRLRRARAD